MTILGVSSFSWQGSVAVAAAVAFEQGFGLKSDHKFTTTIRLEVSLLYLWRGGGHRCTRGLGWFPKTPWPKYWPRTFLIEVLLVVEPELFILQ